MSSGVTVPERPVPGEHPPVGRRTSRLQAVTGPTTWRVNTDRNARKDRRTCDLWYQHGLAIAGDFAGHEMEHAAVFRKLSEGDHIFMHHSGLGVVGFGEVLEEWDGRVYSDDDRVLYVEEIYEYRIRVAWSKEYDCRNRAVPISGRLPHMGTYSEVNPDRWDIAEVVRQLAQATHPQTAK